MRLHRRQQRRRATPGCTLLAQEWSLLHYCQRVFPIQWPRMPLTATIAPARHWLAPLRLPLPRLLRSTSHGAMRWVCTSQTSRTFMSHTRAKTLSQWFLNPRKSKRNQATRFRRTTFINSKKTPPMFDPRDNRTSSLHFLCDADKDLHQILTWTNSITPSHNSCTY